jgi:hypothetical protein
MKVRALVLLTLGLGLSAVPATSQTEVEVGGRRFGRRAVEVFPTVHLGWRF